MKNSPNFYKNRNPNNFKNRNFFNWDNHYDLTKKDEQFLKDLINYEDDGSEIT